MTTVDRHSDQRLYQPRIHSRHIRRLYQIAKAQQIPMTVLLDRAVSLYLLQYDRSQEGVK